MCAGEGGEEATCAQLQRDEVVQAIGDVGVIRHGLRMVKKFYVGHRTHSAVRSWRDVGWHTNGTHFLAGGTSCVRCAVRLRQVFRNGV